MAMNQDLIGRTYEQAEPFEVTQDAARAYADATDAGIAAYEGEGAMAPPMFGVSFSFGALTAPLFDPELGADLMRLVHGEQDMRFLAPVRPGDVIRSRSRIARIEEKSTGELLDIAIDSVNQRGERVLEIVSGLFLRSPRKKEGLTDDRTRRAPSEAAFDALPKRFEARVKVAPDQSVRYAEASGDKNPIHINDDVAKMAGLPGVILHGLCTMAFVHNALVRELGGGPMKVTRLIARFSKPVLMGDELTIDVRGPEGGPLVIEVQNQRGEAVLTAGRAELRA